MSKALEELENPLFSLYMGSPPTEARALQETAPDVEFIHAPGAASLKEE